MTAMEHIEKQLSQLDSKMNNVLQLLKGNELDRDDKGMVGVQTDHDVRLSRLEKMTVQLKYFLYGMALPASWGLIDVLQKLILKK